MMDAGTGVSAGLGPFFLDPTGQPGVLAEDQVARASCARRFGGSAGSRSYCRRLQAEGRRQ
jgi:hypothetical protein